MINLCIHPTADAASAAAADLLTAWLTTPGTHTVMVAGGNTPLDLYRRVSERKPTLNHLVVFALDEYVGVPLDEPRNCANLLRQSVAEAWGIPSHQFFTVSSVERDALASVQAHEQRIAAAGGLDIIILGLGQNGHIGFNEPGSAVDSMGRVLQLDDVSIEANRKWFGGDYAPARGVTVGMKTVLAARRVLLLAFGDHKTASVTAMLTGPRTEQCPASLLQGHADANIFLDAAAGSAIKTAG